MSLTLGAAIALGATSALGAITASGMSGHAAAKATEKQIAWERERAQNAHQWEVADLKAAGLNPILSAGGSGATTGGISAPLPDYSGIANAGQTMADTMLSALSAGQTVAQTANIGADTSNKITQNKYFEAQAINEGLKSGLISAQTAKTQFEALLKEYENQRKEEKFWLDAIHSGTQSAKNISDIAGDWTTVKRFLPRGAQEAIKTKFK